MPKVKCKYCGELLERDSEECVKVAERRYAHKTCAESLSKQEKKEAGYKEQIIQFMYTLYGKETNFGLIERELAKYIKDFNYTYSGIYKSLVYHYEVKKGETEKGKGHLGIVPYVYQDAYNYYYDLWLKQQQNVGIQIKPAEVKHIVIKPPTAATRKIKLFNLDD